MKKVRYIVSKIVCDLKIFAKVERKLGIHVQNLKQLLTIDLVQVAVGERAHIARRLAHVCVHQEVLAENIVLAEHGHDHVALEYLD